MKKGKMRVMAVIVLSAMVLCRRFSAFQAFLIRKASIPYR